MLRVTSLTYLLQGVPPATLAEFTLGMNGQDAYDGRASSEVGVHRI